MKIFSDRRRPVHLGPYPLERLARVGGGLDTSGVPAMRPLSFHRPERPESIVNAMAEFQAMMDVIRDGPVNPKRSEIPEDPGARARHLKAFGYFNDASMVGIGPVPQSARLKAPIVNPGVAALSDALRTRQTKTLASGIDVIMADLRDAAAHPPGPLPGHAHAIVFVTEYHRDPRPDEPGAAWIADAQAHRACLRSAETATVIANYLRLLGHSARAHSGTCADVDLGQLALAAGLVTLEGDALVAPYLGTRFGLAAITTDMALEHDAPLAAMADQPRFRAFGPAWWLGKGFAKSARTQDPFARRDYAIGAHPFETLKRQDTPTTYIDEANVARVPKRTDMFARAQFGDMGKRLQRHTTGGHYVLKSAPSSAQRKMLGALVLLQDGVPGPRRTTATPKENAASIKAASYFLGVDAVGLSRCPDWAWYSHDARGDAIEPPHDQAISMILDQGYETMEGASGDDWISVAQSMRAYLRFSLLGGVIAQQIRNCGYKAKAHTVIDGEVLQPPLLLLSGLGEVSRIGEVILNPFLGPRLKSGAVTTDMPLAHDRPIDFGLQRFCESCNKCARECPSGAITAGPKLMFNGYEIWKSDSQKCATYRITTEGGAMCGRCMKTCPWNLEGIFAEAPFRWAAMHVPAAAMLLARLDDAAGRGGLNPVKKWWWDIELRSGSFAPAAAPVNRRGLQKDLDLAYEDQTLAVYPAPLAPPPYPYPFPMDREAGIKAYQALIPAEEHRRRSAAGERAHLHVPRPPGDAPVLPMIVTGVERMTEDITLYTLTDPEGRDLPEWTAGAHLDVLVAPEFLRQYSMCGDPGDRRSYQIGVLNERDGRGGSALMHRIFTEGRRIFTSRPINHFELVETARRSFLMGGGIGITPMIAFAHRLHRLGATFEMHYSAHSRAAAGFLDLLSSVPWADAVRLHLSDEGTRAELSALIPAHAPGDHLYTCGPDRYMNAVIEAATARGYPDAARHLEYFSLPEVPDHENHPFTLRLKDGRSLPVAADATASEVLLANGIHVDVKCEDGICGVCACGLLAGEVEHRDFVLSAAQRESRIILCQSRAAKPGGEIAIDL
ncbi:2Fe-2S iron-sulfur cluster-binding protein [Oceanibium sediminis]|uniref:2Fe-2S iron-sulfur cluster-binding protein n=1 Tax=Oceanibium sediminis TaxID=2026339 RepID=UPI000DD364EF|nr:reductive dehalogenase domain-containing protein [Oceanibium sediminis]